MNFRVFASGLVLIAVYQLAIAALAVWFVAHCEARAAAPPQNSDPIALTGRQSR